MSTEFWDGSAKKFRFLMTQEQYNESTEQARTNAAARVVKMVNTEIGQLLNPDNGYGLLPGGKHKFINDTEVLMRLESGATVVASHKVIGIELSVKILTDSDSKHLPT